MASFAGTAWLDLVPGADPERILDLIRARTPHGEPGGLYAKVDADRIEIFMVSDDYPVVATLAVAAMRETGVVRRALIALDHDEYGGEWAVLADGRLLQHVLVYPRLWYGLPYRGAEPVELDVPADVRSRGSRWWGHLVDGPEAWAAVAEAYGADVREVERAAYAARTAYPAYGPLQDVLGLEQSDSKPVKLWPGPIWRDAATRFALPHLPGRWLVEDDELVMLPVGLIAGAIQRGRYSSVHVYLRPLYLPFDGMKRHFWDDHPDECDVRESFPRFATVSEGETYMNALVTVVREQVDPFLRRACTLDGYADICRRRSEQGTGRIDYSWTLFRLGATEAVRGRYAEAQAALDDLIRLHARDSLYPPLITAVTGLRRALGDDPDAARATLLAGAAARRRRWDLPDD